MTQAKSTPDERFLRKLHEIASKRGNPFQSVELMVVAKEIGYKESAARSMVKLLAQANLLKKVDDASVCLTQRGLDFIVD